MRIGFNPNKDKIQGPNDFFHQVIVPVYIPNEEGYFKDSLKILEYCLESLFKTIHSKTYITVVNNGSCTDVNEYLVNLQRAGKIHEIIITTNIGKLNAVLKGITGQRFQLITITDADVLFLNDWQKATYEIFEIFPKAGMVSTTPSSKTLRYFTSNILSENIFSKALRFTKVLNPEAMQAFANSIGNIQLYNRFHLDKYLTLSKGNMKAVIGAGHFVATYRGEIFDNLKQRNSIYSLGGNGESEILDRPVFEQGYWRLSTEDNYSYHMGNVFEPWMNGVLSSLKINKENRMKVSDLGTISNSKFKKGLQSFFLNKVLMSKPIWKRFLQYKGLTAEEANQY